MITTTDAVREIVRKSPFVQEMLRQNWLNLSQYALSIHPEVEQISWKRVQPGSIITALGRLRLEIQESFTIKLKINDLSLKYPISELNYPKKSAHEKKIGETYLQMSPLENHFLNIISGNTETTLFVNSKYQAQILKIFQPQKPNLLLDCLGIVSIKFDPEYLDTEGAVYQVLKSLVWEKINLLEVISTYTELSLVVTKDNSQKAFDLISRDLG